VRFLNNDLKEITMKAVLMITIACLVAATAMAQQETIFKGPIKSGGYGAPIIKFGQIGDESAIWVGAKGGWIINHTLMLGGGGYGLVSEVDEYEIGGVPIRRLGVGYGGFIMEYIHKSNRLVHFTFETLIGGGGASYWYHENDTYWNDNYTDSFFALEPGMSIMVNFTENIQVGAGVSYLYTSGFEFSDFDDSDLTGPMGHFLMKFGYF
jgi:hypothetical protein